MQQQKIDDELFAKFMSAPAERCELQQALLKKIVKKAQKKNSERET